MKILHCSDWHLGAYVGPQCEDPYKRMENTIKCLDTVLKTALEMAPDIILITGDLFHAAKVWSDRALTEVRVAAGYINNFAQIAPTIVLYGTPNHDGDAQFKALRAMTGKHAHFYTEPQVFKFMTSSGEIQVAGLPGFDKGYLRAKCPGLPAEQENQILTQQLSLILQGLSAQLDPVVPSVLMAHHTVAGSAMDNDQNIYLQNEVLLEPSAIDGSAFDLVCMGHIHKAQRVDICQKPVYYAGSIDAFTFNDELHEKGFFIHYLHDEYEYNNFIPTPARGFQTERWIPEEISQYLSGEPFCYPEKIKNKVVRVLYSCDSETEKALDKKKLERDLYAAGAYYVSEIRPEKITADVNQERLHEKLTAMDCLTGYMEEKRVPRPIMMQIYDEARPLIEEAEASQPAGGQTGLFLPLEIEVNNYRSYKEQKLSFEDIYFTMINGQNGAGKSSLFMDAIVDCLFEQPREGDLTGWIRSGEKSGSISFTFLLGNNTYRVTRTRQRSGKATLALSMREMFSSNALDFSEDWGDISCQRLVDTQQKIVDILGMDADTFRSCVLIMQDQYGRFMESKPEDRMSVLANLLGLGIYEQLEEITKKKLTDVNRDLKNAKQDVAALEQEVSELFECENLLAEKKEKCDRLEAALKLLKQECDETSVNVIKLDQLEQSKRQVSIDIEKLRENLRAKSDKSSFLIEAINQTKQFLANEDSITQAYEELQECKQKLAARDNLIQRLKEKEDQAAKLNDEIDGIITRANATRTQVVKLKSKIDACENIDKEISEVEKEAQMLPEYEKKLEKYRELQSIIAGLQKDRKVIETEIGHCKAQAQMLDSANCIDIDRASCKFLAAAKRAAAQIAEYSKQLKELEKQAEDLEIEMLRTGYSPSVHQHAKQASEKYSRLLQQKASLDGDKKLYETLDKNLADLHIRKAQLDCDRININVDIDQLYGELKSFDSIQSKINELAKAEEQWKQLPAAKSYLKTAQDQIQDLATEISTLSHELGELEGKEAGLTLQINDGQKYRDTLKQLKDKITAEETALMQASKEIGTLEAQLTELRKKEAIYAERKEQIEKLAGQASRLQLLAEAFSQDGIPHQIIRDIIPELEANANEILSKMTGGRMRIEFRTERVLKSNKAKEVATLDIVIVDVDHGELPYLARSGGQKVRAALAVSFALAIIKASRVGLQLGMMFVDEPPYLDAEGVDAYCTALRAIHDRYPDMRIVAISHDENMKNHFPQQLFVDVTDQGSRIRRLA